MKNLPKNPANGGIPARPNMAIDIQAARMGFFLPNPLKALISSEPVDLNTGKAIANAAMVDNA